MSTGEFYLLILFLILSQIECIRITPNSTTVNSTISDKSVMNRNTSTKNSLDQGKEMIHDAFSNMDRGTIIRGAIVLAGITGLVVMYVGIKAFL